MVFYQWQTSLSKEELIEFYKLELSHQSCLDHSTSSNPAAPSIRKRLRYKTNKQMGKLCNPVLVTGSHTCHPLLISFIIQFNVELDETDALRDDIRVWKSCDVLENRPPPMVIEVFIDTEELNNNQSLTIIDDHGKRWDVEEALMNAAPPASHRNKQRPKPRVVLERWHIELGDMTKDIPKDLGMILPRIYKNSIVLFRSLYTFARFLPAWKLGRRVSKPRSSHTLPKLKYRIISRALPTTSADVDELTLPLFDGHDHVTDQFNFGTIDSPAGQFSIKVLYRPNCDFRIDNSEALLSSHFMGMDEDMFEPSLGHHKARKLQRTSDQPSRQNEVGSLPQARKDASELADQGQAYGSLSTFHNAGPRVSSSPLSALRAARDMNPQSPANSPPLKAPPNHRSAQGSRSSLRSTETAPGMGRRTSVSFMPFKTPSLSASPLQTEQVTVSSPRGSLGKASPLSALTEARNPGSSNPNPTLPQKGSPILHEQPAVPSVSSSPRPAPTARYSSSFGHRRARLSVGGGSRTEDDNNSSGKTSLTSSAARPGSEVLVEGGGASSDSMHTDDDNISEFLKMLDQKKDLKSFQTPKDSATADASTRRTTAALSKFQRLRESHAALSDSMLSSQVMHRSSSSSSRQLSSVPPMVAGTSISTSSSPGKPVSPHTPHTPAIPSRLSANSIVDYTHRERSAGRHRLSHGEEPHAEETEDGQSRNQGTGAIPIPTSPRPYQPSYRRSSSVAQQHRPLPLDDDLADILPFGMRSASLGDGDEREPVSLSALLRLQQGTDVAIRVTGHHERPFGPAPNTGDGEGATQSQQSFSLDGREDDCPSSVRGIPYRARIGRGSGRGITPPQGSSSSLAGGDRGTGSGSSDQRAGRYSFTRPASHYEEEEPFIFAMSDFNTVQQSRRSLEEGRGGWSGGMSERGGGDSRASSRRGSRGGKAGNTWS